MTSSLPTGDLKALALALSPAKFADYCLLPPDDWQRELYLSQAPRVALCTGRQMGKSSCLAVLSLWTALYQPGSVVLMASPTLRQSSEIFRRVLTLYRLLERPIPPESESALQLHLQNNSRIISLPGGEASVRGYTAHLIIFDEAARVDPALFEALLPSVAVTRGRIIAASTPAGVSDWFSSLFLHPDPDEHWHTIKRTAVHCKRISEEFLQSEQRALGVKRFSVEYMCSFEDSGNLVFDPYMVRSAVKKTPSKYDLDLE